MALDTMIQELVTARRKYDEAKAACNADVICEQVVRHLSSHIPPGHALAWAQYTPSFNDGDPCTFSVHDPSLVRTEETDPKAVDIDSDSCTDLGTVIDRWGKPDETVEYEDRDFSARPLPGGDFPKVKKSYVRSGFLAVEGWDVERIGKLGEAWDALPEDLLEATFGDHARVVILPSGAYHRGEVND